MKVVDKETMLEQAKFLFEGTSKEDNPEYLRGMCELIAYCFGEEDLPTEQHVAMLEAEILAKRGNLHTPADVWLKELFQSEYCAECGGDAEHHTALPFEGNWFARCDFPHDGEKYHPVIVKFRNFACERCGHTFDEHSEDGQKCYHGSGRGNQCDCPGYVGPGEE